MEVNACIGGILRLSRLVEGNIVKNVYGNMQILFTCLGYYIFIALLMLLIHVCGLPFPYGNTFQFIFASKIRSVRD